MKTAHSKDGTPIAYDVYGSGPALIYITGASCFRTFMPIVQDAKTFAEQFTVYCYDRRGRGDSGNTLPYAVEREVEDIEALIDAAGGKASLYGHSSGAVLALEAGLHCPDKIDKLVLYDPSYVHDETERVEYDQLRQEVEGLLQHGKNAKAMTSFLKRIGMPSLFVYLLRLMPGWKTMKALAPTLLYDIELTRELAPFERAAQLQLPALVAVGEKSPAGVRTVGQQLSGAIPNASFLQVSGQDHMPSAKIVLQMLTRFLKQAA